MKIFDFIRKRAKRAELVKKYHRALPTVMCATVAL